MTPYQVWRTRSGAPIALFGLEPQDDGTVLALGAHTPAPLKAGRVLLAPDGTAYALTERLSVGLALVDGPTGHQLPAPIVLARRRTT